MAVDAVVADVRCGTGVPVAAPGRAGTWLASPILLAGLYVQTRNPVWTRPSTPMRSPIAATPWSMSSGPLGSSARSFLLREAWEGVLADRDFVAVWVAGKLAAAGHAAQAFDNATLLATAKQLVGTEPRSLIPIRPMRCSSRCRCPTCRCQSLSGAGRRFRRALFFLAARPYLPSGFPRLLGGSHPGRTDQCPVWAGRALLRRALAFAFSGSAIAAAALTFKPHLGVLVAVEAARRRQILLTSASRWRSSALARPSLVWTLGAHG